MRYPILNPVQYSFNKNQIRNLIYFSEKLQLKDKELWTHTKRVTRYAYTIAHLAGTTVNDQTLVILGAFLHDIGKLNIPVALLNKSDKLSHNEWQLMKSHTTLGYEMLIPFQDIYPEEVLCIVQQHHERLDSLGYPFGLNREEISPLVKIVTLADCYDAMTSGRKYSKAKSMDEAINELCALSNIQFDAGLAELFIDFLIRKKSLAPLPAPIEKVLSINFRYHE